MPRLPYSRAALAALSSLILTMAGCTPATGPGTTLGTQSTGAAATLPHEADLPLTPAPPPPPRLEEIPPPPMTGHALWQPGHWDWASGAWVWTAGAYVQRPAPGNWVAGHWMAQASGKWAWTDGNWH